MAITESATQLAPSCTDHELVARVRGGNDRAFEELYTRYGGRIRSYVLGMVSDHGRAEDLTQEVFISALRRLRDTERPIAFKPWIYEIAKNACIDDFRRGRRTREIPLEPRDSSEALPSQGLAPAADAAMEAKQRLDDLRGAFRGLSDSHHRIIVMREFEGLSYGQISARTGMSKPIVESTLFRARRRLSEEYDELVSGRRCEHVQSVIATEGERPLRSLGLRDRRQLARHLSHCQPCRRVARAAGVDDSFFHAPGLASKIAALFPFGWLRLRRGERGHGWFSASGAHSTALVRPLQTMGPMVDPAGAGSALGRTLAAVAAIVVAGAGGGVVAGLTGHRSPRHAAQAAPAITPAASIPPGGGSSAQAAGSSAAGRSAQQLTRAGGSTSTTLKHGSRSRSKTASSRGAAPVAGRYRSSARSTAGGTPQKMGAGSGSGSSASSTGAALPTLPVSAPTAPSPPVPTTDPVKQLPHPSVPPVPPVNPPLPKVDQPPVPVPNITGVLPPQAHQH